MIAHDQIKKQSPGIADQAVDEEEGFVKKGLQLLEHEIGQITGNSRYGYDLAMRLNPQYVENKNFRIMFLRASGVDSFDAKKAAACLISHFQLKLDLFGEDKLVRDIQFEDLDNCDQKSLFRGCTQFLGVRDAQGRNVIFGLPELHQLVPLKNRMRALWYQCMLALEDETTQRLGMVFVSIGNASGNAKHVFFDWTPAVSGLPFRLNDWHVCLFDTSERPLAELLTFWTGNGSNVRVWVHLEDTYLNHFLVLQKFGINLKSDPSGVDGMPKRDNFVRCIQDRRAQENARSDGVSRSTNVVPTDRDILIGRGRGFCSHAGNIVLERFVEESLPRYMDERNNFGKASVVLEIVERIKDRGGRFLRRDNISKKWSVVADTTVHDLVSFRFRQAKKRSHDHI